ncbi:MAG: T9SS type A sorting domain-containing protein, partial [Bacteroidota bacterium]
KQLEAGALTEASSEEIALSTYPNPFNPSTRFEYRVAQAGFVSLKIYDLLGREVAVLVNEEKQPGAYSVVWNAGAMPSGVYFSRLESNGKSLIRKLLLVR